MYNTKVEDIIKAQSNNEEAMTKILESNNGLIWNIVRRFLGRGYEAEDLYQIGCIGFIKSIKRFDTSLNLQISTYAVPYIMGEIKRFIRDDGPIKVSRSLKELLSKIRDIQRKYLLEKGENINISAITKILHVPKEEIVMALESENPIESIDEERYDDSSNGETKIAKIASGVDETNRLINKMSLEQLIDSLEDREKKIIILRYYKEKTQSEVAKILGITQVQVSRLEKKIILSFREKLLENKAV